MSVRYRVRYRGVPSGFAQWVVERREAGWLRSWEIVDTCDSPNRLEAIAERDIERRKNYELGREVEYEA